MNIDTLFNTMVNSRCFTLIKNMPASQRFKHCICDRLTENYN